MNRYKIPLLLTSLLFIFVSADAQEPLAHKKKFYQSQDGKLYVNKDMPLYFKISSSPADESESHLLNPSADSKKYANPMYLDTEGYNTFRSPSKVDTVTKKVVYPVEDVIYEIYADSKPPATTSSFNGKKFYKNEGIHYFGEKIKLDFNAKDATSGLENTYFSINGQAYKKLEDSIMLDQEKLYEIKYYSVDNVGNAEKPKDIKIKIDITNPETRLSVSTDNYNDILSPRSKIILEAKDENSKVKQTFFSINEGTEYNYHQPVNISGLSEGEHTISYYSVDHVNNKESKKTYPFYLDKTPPMIIDELIGNTFVANGREYSSGRSRVKLTAMDNKAGVKEIRYSINDGEFQEYTKPFYLNQSGKLKIQTFVTDHVNNQKISTIMTDKSKIAYVDLSGPALGHHFEGPHFVSKDTVFVTNKTKIRLSANDEGAGFKRMEYSLDNEPVKEYTEPFTVNKEGVHTINYTGYDNVDNSSTNTFICVEDNTGPEIFFRFSMLSEKSKNVDNKRYDVYPSHVVLFLSSTDALVGFDKIVYSINGSTPRQYNTLIKDFKPGTQYSIDVTSTDKLGNESDKQIDFFIE